MNDDEVSVVELLEREGWDERVPPRPGSRLRVLAVMGAVVFGCGVAAAVVSTLPGDGEQDQGLEEPSIIRFPERTALTVGPDEKEQEESERGVPAGPTSTGSGATRTSGSTASSTTESSAGTTASSTGSASADPDPTSEEQSTTARSDSPDPPPDPSPPRQTTTTTETEEPCFIWIFC
ncbi:hypothetical protein [Amycolatopsis aidingensis]|uniref:hypothetical protein n=1 Tax=Amycolatopsis aidingensis TaxID=2842453 RepID=UPI001C0CBCB0|nr:hypothetical protein [Amycolatopsis aidingensis]